MPIDDASTDLPSLSSADRANERDAAADWAAIDALRERNADADPDQVLTDATAAVDAVRRAHRHHSPAPPNTRTQP